eukprot:772256-Prorocentrum_lima.AAC.1
MTSSLVGSEMCIRDSFLWSSVSSVVPETSSAWTDRRKSRKQLLMKQVVVAAQSLKHSCYGS